MYTDFEEAVSSPVLSTSTSSGLGWSPLGVEDSEQKDGSDLHPLDLRPWDITVLINLYKVHGRLPMVRGGTHTLEDGVCNRGHGRDLTSDLCSPGSSSTAAARGLKVPQASWSVCVLR